MSGGEVDSTIMFDSKCTSTTVCRRLYHNPTVIPLLAIHTKIRTTFEKVSVSKCIVNRSCPVYHEPTRNHRPRLCCRHCRTPFYQQQATQKSKRNKVVTLATQQCTALCHFIRLRWINSKVD